MLKYYQSSFKLIKGSRFIYNHEAADYKKDYEKATQNLENLELTGIAGLKALDDKKYTWKESLEKGRIHEYMGVLEQQANGVIPPLVNLTNAFNEYDKYKGDDGEILCESVIDQLIKVKTAENWKDTIIKDSAFKDLPLPLINDVQASNSAEEALIKCGSFLIKWENKKMTLDTAVQVDQLKQALLTNVANEAAIALQLKQSERLSAAQRSRIEREMDRLFPKTSLDSNLERKRSLVSAYLDGVLNPAQLKVDPAEIEIELNRCLEKTNDETIKNYVNDLIIEKNTDTDSPDKNAPLEVKAYLKGLLDSFSNKDGAIGEEQHALVMNTFNALPAQKQNDLFAVKEAFAFIHNIYEFESSKKKFIEGECQKLVPDNPDDPKLSFKREIAYQYLKGLFSSTAMQFDGEKDMEEFESYMQVYYGSDENGYSTVPEYPKVKNWGHFEPKYKAVLSSGNQATDAFMDGILDTLALHSSKAGEIDDNKWQLIRDIYSSIPTEELADVEKVSSYFRSISIVCNMGDMEESKAYRTMRNPQLNHFYSTRMANARAIFSGKPDEQGKILRYRQMLLKAISEQDSDSPQMAALNSLPQPEVFEAPARQIKDSDMPDDKKLQAIAMPKEIKSYVNNVLSQLSQSKSEKINIQLQRSNCTYYIKTNPLQCFKEIPS